MQATRNKSFLILFALVLSIILIGYRLHLHQSGRSIIDGDGKGYYAYLPAWYKTISGNHDPVKSFSSIDAPAYMVHYGDTYYNKYPPGTAFCILPAFVAATFFQALSGNDYNPFANIFHLVITLNGWLFLLAGCFFVFRILRLLYPTSKTTLYSIVGIVFGTNLIFYAVDEPAMSHIYAFTCISGFVFMLLQFQKTTNTKYLYPAVFFFSMAVSIRYFHLLLVLTLPYFLQTKSLKNFRIQIWSIAFLLLSCMPVFMVILSNLSESGLIFPPSYPGEGFYFLRPRLAETLFGIRKGLFSWFPLLIPAFTGLFFLENRKLLPWLVVTVYLLASWWNWYFGDGFGLRPYSDYMVFLSIGLEAVMVRLQNRMVLHKAFVGIGFLFIAWNIFLSWQYLNGIIPPDGMNAEKALFVIGKTDKKYAGLVRGEKQEIFGTSSAPLFEHNDTLPFVFDAQTAYAKAIDYVFTNSLTDGNRYLASMDVLYLEENYSAAGGSLFTIGIFDESGKTIFWNSGFVTPLPRVPGKWYPGAFAVILPEEIPSGARIRFVIWNEKAECFSIKNLHCDIRRFAVKKN